MLHVRSLSGDPVAELHVKELETKLQESERSLVVALKRILGAQLGCSRFRLKLLGEDRRVIDDDVPLIGPAEFTLVRMDFQSSDVATNKAFIAACKGRRVREVERLLHAPQDPDAREARDNCAGIHHAAWNGDVAIVRLLLEAGADKDAAWQNETALHLASRKGHLDIARVLLEAGADQDAAMQDGHTALHSASRKGHLDIVRLLLDPGVDKDAARQNGETALHLASRKGHLDVVRLLLEAGANKDAARQNGATALHGASDQGHLDIVRVLLEAGADKDARKHDGATAMHLMATWRLLNCCGGQLLRLLRIICKSAG